MQRNPWENLTGLFIAGVKTTNGETFVSGWDWHGKPVTLKVSGECEKVEKKSPGKYPHQAHKRTQ